MDRRFLFRFAMMLFAFCMVLGIAMIWLRAESRHIPIENALVLKNVSSRVDSVLVLQNSNNETVLQIRVRLEGLVVDPDGSSR